MQNTVQDTRSRIISVTLEILNEVSDIDKITIRQISERANIGVGLINYHFKSKNNLLSLAVGDVMSKMAANMHTKEDDLNKAIREPAAKLKKTLKELCSFGNTHEKLLQFMLTQSIQTGDMDAPLALIPVLREIYGTKKDEVQLRTIALQIISPIQFAALNPSRFHLYSGINLKDERQRNEYIETLVDNLIPQSI